jgi:hypothetical protein
MMPNGLWWEHPAKRAGPGSTQAPQSGAIIRAGVAFFARLS